MSVDTTPEISQPVQTLDDLVAWFQEACTPRAQWRVGVEHERIAVVEGTADPVPYEGPRGIRELLGRARRLGYEPFFDGSNPIAAHRNGQWWSLEPGGQVEFAGRPHRDPVAVADEHLRASARLRALGAELGIRLLAVGYRPFGSVAQARWIPKRRYAAMREALAPRGALALAMMAMTGSVQASYDFADERDCAEKVRAAASVASIVTALFANSPIVDGALSGHQSFRARVWRDVDPARCGLLPMYFDEEGFTFRRYAQWAAQVPMIFIRRAGRYLSMGGITFARFLAEGFGGERATRVDWADHLTLLFPEVRLKKVLELRSADACDLAVSNALPALGYGVLYDRGAREAATALTAGLGIGERLALHERAARLGLRGRVPGSRRTLREAAAELLTIAAEGLRRRGRADAVRLLAPLAEIVASGRSPADRLIAAWRTGDPQRLLAACGPEGGAGGEAGERTTGA